MDCAIVENVPMITWKTLALSVEATVVLHSMAMLLPTLRL